MTDSDGWRALYWYSGLPEEALYELAAWLPDHPPPEGKSQVQHAFDHRGEIFNQKGENGED